MDAFDPQTLATDLIEVRRIFDRFFAARSPADWERRTERSGRGWTLRETVAHLDSIGQTYHQSIQAALAGHAYPIPGLVKRTDLPTWNQRQIEARAHLPMTMICDSFLHTLQQAADCAAHLSLTASARTIPLPIYGRPLAVAELLGGQAAHPGIVHAAQVANGASVAPLWVQFTPELMQRQITRFFRMMSLSYWPERGGNLRTTITLIAAGQGGGKWQITLAPEGSSVATEPIPRSTLRVWFRNTDVLCRAFTLQLSPLRALLTAQALAWGDLRLGFRLESLFSPT